MAKDLADGEVDAAMRWDAIAPRFIEQAAVSTTGVAAVRSWVQGLVIGSSVLDVGCGPGSPRSDVLYDHGLQVWAIDASPRLIESYRRRHPEARVNCALIQTSPLFGRRFDGVFAWGLLFLLPPDQQRQVIARLGAALERGGRFLFTAPARACTWADLSTGQVSCSLGFAGYQDALQAQGIRVTETLVDEGMNHYFLCSKD